MCILPCLWDWKGLPAPKWCFPPLSALKPEAKVTLVGWFLIFLACFLSFAFDISGKKAIYLIDREKTLILKIMNCQTRLFTSAFGRQRQDAQELSLATQHETSLRYLRPYFKTQQKNLILKQASKTTQQVKGLADEPDGLHSIPGTYTMQRESLLLKAVLCQLHVHCDIPLGPHTNKC